MRSPLLTVTFFGLVGCRGEATPPPATPATESASNACAASLEARAKENLRAAGPSGAVVLVDVVSGEEIVAVHAGIEPDQEIHPASTVKPFLAAEALERGLLDPEEKITCAGTWRRDDAQLSCFAEHGPIDLRAALATSCNAYFYELAARLGPAGVAAAYRRFGLDGPASAAERAPDLATMIATAIGHADAHVTPRELAHAHARLASEHGSVFGPVHAGLRDAVEGDRGTGGAARVEGLSVAGKTGTADAEEEGRFHAWFAGYAPAESPRVLALVYVEADTGGGKSAAPIASAVLEAWRDHCASD
jgi:penicillin-binding protein 2